MNSDWDKSIEFVLKMEGGSSPENVPDDSGGWTKFGISQKAYPMLDIKNLTLDEARAIYMKDYWVPCGGDDLPWPLSISTFDCAVNMGVKTSIRMLQMALEVDVDGIIGEKTITAAKQATPGRIRKRGLWREHGLPVRAYRNISGRCQLEHAHRDRALALAE